MKMYLNNCRTPTEI